MGVGRGEFFFFMGTSSMRTLIVLSSLSIAPLSVWRMRLHIVGEAWSIIRISSCITYSIRQRAYV